MPRAELRGLGDDAIEVGLAEADVWVLGGTRREPTIGVAVTRAAASSRPARRRRRRGLSALLVVSAHLACAQGDLDEARRLLERAIALTEDTAGRAFLLAAR